MSSENPIPIPPGLVGLFGGAFDPPHNGHVALIREALLQLSLRKLLVVVTGIPPHKDIESSADERLSFAELAFSEIEGVEVSQVELNRPGISYTLDTVKWAYEEYGETIFLIGTDQFLRFPSWHKPEEILEFSRLVVATRPGFDREVVQSTLAEISCPDRVYFLETPEIPVSSYEIRRRIGLGYSIEGLVPDSVAYGLSEGDSN